MRETQASVVEWTGEHYAHETGDVVRKLLNLIEEVGEISSELGLDPEVAAAQFLRSARRPARGGDVRDIKGAYGEVGDVRLSLYDLAEAMGVDADQALDDKMAVNRAKTVAESHARLAVKRTAGL